MKSRKQIKREISKLHKEMRLVLRAFGKADELSNMAQRKFEDLDRKIMAAYYEKAVIEINLREQNLVMNHSITPMFKASKRKPDKTTMQAFEKQIAYAKQLQQQHNMQGCRMSGTANCPWDDNPNIICWSVSLPRG